MSVGAGLYLLVLMGAALPMAAWFLRDTAPLSGFSGQDD